jgi:hypothetical protein
MKQLALLPILLLLGVGITSGPASAELTASHSVPPSAPVGQTVAVTVMLYNGGSESTQVVVTPGLPGGVVTDPPGSWPSSLTPKSQSVISYPIRAVESGTYWITSQIAYSEGGVWRELRLEAPFTAEGSSTTPLVPAPEGSPQATPQGIPSNLPGSDQLSGEESSSNRMPPSMSEPPSNKVPQSDNRAPLAPSNNELPLEPAGEPADEVSSDAA